MADLTGEELAFLQGALDLARSGSTNELVELLAEGLPVNLTSGAGDSLLVLAAYHDHPETVEALLARGADTERVNDRGQTALGAAVFRRSERSVRALVAAGADPDGGQRTAREIGQFFGLVEMAKLLDVLAGLPTGCEATTAGAPWSSPTTDHDGGARCRPGRAQAPA